MVCNKNTGVEIVWNKNTGVDMVSNMFKTNNKGTRTTTARKMKFSIKDYFSKCDQIRRKLRIWSNLL